jgi:hypothetical protein
VAECALNFRSSPTEWAFSDSLRTVDAMEHSTASAKVWAYLEHLGCEQVTVTRHGPDGRVLHQVEIRLRGAAVAIEEHASLSVATSRAIVDAAQLVVPDRPASTPPRPFALTPCLPLRQERKW